MSWKKTQKVKEPSEMREKELLRISFRFGVCVTGMVVCTEERRDLARGGLGTY